MLLRPISKITRLLKMRRPNDRLFIFKNFIVTFLNINTPSDRYFSIKRYYENIFPFP